MCFCTRDAYSLCISLIARFLRKVSSFGCVLFFAFISSGIIRQRRNNNCRPKKNNALKIKRASFVDLRTARMRKKHSPSQRINFQPALIFYLPFSSISSLVFINLFFSLRLILVLLFFHYLLRVDFTFEAVFLPLLLIKHENTLLIAG